MVRQGQIGELIAAKPTARRALLEEAAGISGLHSRRHEAELRLKAAENNLERLEDVTTTLATQIESLKRQARQAKRYKELSEDIRRSEALVLHLAWTAAQADVDYTETMLSDTLSRVAEATQAEAVALRQEADSAAALDPLREDEAKRGAAVARVKIEQETFEKEAQRLSLRRRELDDRAAQLARDIAREEELVREARELLAGLAAESQALTQRAESDAAGEGEARERLAEADGLLKAAETRLGEATRHAFEARGQRQSLEAGRLERSTKLEN
jgi:chromosome segregation protein